MFKPEDIIMIRFYNGIVLKGDSLPSINNGTACNGHIVKFEVHDNGIMLIAGEDSTFVPYTNIPYIRLKSASELGQPKSSKDDSVKVSKSK